MSARKPRRRHACTSAVCEALETRRLLAASLSLSGSQLPTPGATINVSSDGAFGQSEMLIAVNPTNPLNIVGFSHRLTSPITLDVYRSTDGGGSWTITQIDSTDDGFPAAGNRFDPTMAFDATGRLYIAYGVRGTAGPPATATRLITAVSTDGGQNFTNFRVLDTQNDPNGAGTSPPGVDRWTITTGTAAATTTQAAVIAYTQNVLEGANVDQRIVVVGTRDGGANWTAPLTINDGSINGTDGGNLGASPTIGLGGELWVAWYDGGTSILIDSDRDGLWGSAFNFGTDRTVRSGPGVVPITPPAQPDRGLRVSPVLASNIYNGDVYVTFQEVFGASANNDTDIWFGRSTDAGQSWTWTRVEGSTGTDFHPMMAVDRQSNAIGIAYYTTDGDQATGNDDVRMRIALSGDFGSTWSRANVSAQTSNETGGSTNDYLEYTGLDLRDGTAHVLWASRYPGGGQDLDAFTARVSLDSSTDNNILRIVGSGTPPANNNFIIRRSTTNADYIEVFTDGVRDYTGLAASINSVVIESGGIDTYTIENLPAIPVRIIGSAGSDTISINRLTGASLLTIDLGNGDDVVGLGTGAFDVGTITSPVVFNGGDGNDTLYVGSGNADAITANVTFNGQGTPGGLGNRIVYNDQGVQYQVEYDVAPGVVTRRGFFSPRTVTYTGTSRIILNAGADGDLITVRNGVSPVIEAYGYGGDDIFTRGVVNPGGGAIFNGGTGNNTITFDGTAENVGRLWDIYPDRVIFGGIFNYLTTGFQSVSVLAGGGDDTITFFAGSATYSQAITADGGGGSDTFRSLGARIASLTVRGGGGFDYLNIDDRTTAANLDSYALYPNQYTRYQFGPSGPSYTASYSGFESMTAWRTADQAFVEIFGTSPEIDPAYSTWLVGNTTDSVIYVYPRDGQGNLTIGSNVRLSGGGTAASDQVIINDSGSALPITYRLFNQFSNSTAYIGGMGNGWVGVETDFDSLTFHAGSGDDVFNIDGYRSPTALAINGGAGDDTVHWTPVSKDLGNIGSQTSFNFNGGAGHDEMRFHNDNSTSAYTYYPSGLTLGALRHSTGMGMGSITAANLELMYVSGTPQADGFNIWSASAGTVLELAGRGGNDVYGLGGIFPTNAQTIRSLVRIDGSGGGDDTIAIYGQEDSVGRTVHLTQDTIGAFPGDNLFGPGGSVQFRSMTGPIQLHLGSGADTVYARPNETAAITINGNNPTAAPGDRLNLALAGAGSYAINGTAASGNVSSSNRQTLNWAGFETGPAVDDVAPAVVAADININGINGLTDDGHLRRQSIDVQFSEDVSALISPSWLELMNLTTSQPIPASNVAVSYDTTTNTAHFTFPGYANGVLPDGNYQGRVLAGLPDFFGNALPADVPFDFFFLNGDANRDGRVNLRDFNILAANFGQSNRTFSQGDFNYDGMVNLQDFNILASRFGQALGPDGQLMQLQDGRLPPMPTPPHFSERAITPPVEADGDLEDLVA